MIFKLSLPSDMKSKANLSFLFAIYRLNWNAVFYLVYLFLVCIMFSEKLNGLCSKLVFIEP